MPGHPLYRPSEERAYMDSLADIGIIVPAPVYIHIDSVILLTKPFSHVIIISKHG